MISRLIIGSAFIFSMLLIPAVALASGHGPVFGLATPTLAKGGWSFDVAVMDRAVAGGQAVMLRPMIGYGLTENLQVSVSAPVPIRTGKDAPQSRVVAMMPANPDFELLLGWRFHRQDTGVGSRFESTAYLGFAYPADGTRNALETSPGLSLAAVTGYASRSVYFWVGGFYHRSMRSAGTGSDRPGDLVMYSFVAGYRPGRFRKELPHADWRLFIETVGEYSAEDRVSGKNRPDSGGHRIFIGPTLLGLYGPWGVSFGPLIVASI